MSIALHNAVSFYPKAWQIDSQEVIPLDLFLDGIRDGKWEDIAHKVRAIKDKKQRDELKKKIAPSITVSGKFNKREDKELESHSGFIGMDLDEDQFVNRTPEDVKAVLINDPYIAAAFTSISGRGLCLLFRIAPEKHREAFQGICEYLFKTYNIIADPTSINVSRARFVSYDPHIYIADRAEKFTKYPKSKPPKKVDRVIYAKNDFDYVLQQIVDKRLNLTEDYHDWIRMGFAIASKFGEQGRDYFHIVSQYSAKYDVDAANKQYDIIVKRNSRTNGGNEVNISTFYYYCKEAGIDIYTDRTKKIAYSAKYGKKGGLDESEVEKNLANFEEITGEDVRDIIQQVYNNNIDISDDGMIEQLEMWIRQTYQLERNEITRYIENNGEIIKQKDFNTIFIRAKKIFEKLSYEIVDRLINSDFVPTYNPFHRFFYDHTLKAKEQAFPDVLGNMGTSTQNEFKAKNTAPPLITKLFSTISTPDPDYLLCFGTKWLVGFISAIHGEHSPLMLVLSGETQNTGKTEWFRRLLPREWLPYYAESKLDAGKDDEILMTQKILIMDDEMGGKSKKEVKRLKELTSKQTFSLREPYGRNNVDLNRLAVLGGTTNDNEILSDPTGNRRIIPIHVDAINHQVYNSIDKTALWLEVYDLWKGGYRWQLNRDDIAYLAKHGGEFEMAISETELIQKYFEPGETEWVTATDIKVYIEKHTQQRLNLGRLGQDLKRLGFQQKHIKQGNSTKRVYGVVYTGNLNAVNFEVVPPKRDDDDLPF